MSAPSKLTGQCGEVRNLAVTCFVSLSGAA